MPPAAEHSILPYLHQALDLARLSPPKPTNFRVGALLLIPGQTPNTTTDASSSSSTTPAAYTILTTGYTLEHPGNTHAEQVCFQKACTLYNCTEDALGTHLPAGTELVTTMEPCVRRSAGNTACVDRVLGLTAMEGGGGCAIRRVWVGVREPETFVGVNEGRAKLEGAGVEVLAVPGLEEEILRVATAGHGKTGGEDTG